MEKKLTTPLAAEDIADLRVGDIVYLDGMLATCRDISHRRRVLKHEKPDFELAGMAIFHAGPIVQQCGDGGWRMVSIGPTTRMRMEKYQAEFIALTGVKLIIGKGGMGEKTAAACREHKTVHAVFPGGCAVVAAEAVEEITSVEWLDQGMPEAFWVCRVKGFGPLIISIDTEGNNLFENNKQLFHTRQAQVMPAIMEKVHFMK
ncbi:MAG: L(+)-tartrate dehydratase subunit beta [Syntrophomonadaceae bacterium]|nr:L(+)-tartrate dehydratase subunit beta [Syntrophomonadaceae bacterium]